MQEMSYQLKVGLYLGSGIEQCLITILSKSHHHPSFWSLQLKGYVIRVAWTIVCGINNCGGGGHCDIVRAPLDELLLVEMMSRAADI